jgi:hypothetical protein
LRTSFHLSSNSQTSPKPTILQNSSKLKSGTSGLRLVPVDFRLRYAFSMAALADRAASAGQIAHA